MFAIDMVSNIDMDRISAEITFRGQIVCEVYLSEPDGGFEVNFSGQKYVEIPDVDMKFPLLEFQAELAAAVALLNEYR